MTSASVSRAAESSPEALRCVGQERVEVRCESGENMPGGLRPGDDLSSRMGLVSGERERDGERGREVNVERGKGE
jgi:hypothetical protein